MKYILPFILITVFWSCTTFKNIKQTNNLSQFHLIGIDSTRLKIVDCFTFNESLNQVKKGEKEIAVSVEIRDTNLLYHILIKEGSLNNRDPRKFIFLNKDGVIVHNQTYAWKTRGDTIKGLICNILPDSINEINLFEYKWDEPEIRLNNKPLRIRKAQLPFRNEGFYKTLKFHRDIAGYFEKDLNESTFLIKSYDQFDNASIVQIGINTENIKLDTLNYNPFYSFAKNEKLWTAKTHEKRKNRMSWEELKNILIVGTNSRNFNLNDSRLIEYTGESTTSSIYFGDNLFNLDTYGGKIYKFKNDINNIDSSFWTSINTKNDFKATRPKIGIIEYSKHKQGVRYGNRILTYNDNKWNIIHKIEKLEKCFGSSSNDYSTAIDNKGFYFIAKSKAYYSDFSTSEEILLDFDNIMAIRRGPPNYLIIELGRTKDEVEGLIYNVKTKEVYPIYSYKINHYFDFLTVLIKYRSYSNTILLMTNFGTYEIDFEEIIQYSKNN